jgi:CHAT domain-containing protein
LPDGRRPRLLSDLANYTLACGRLFGLPEARLEAERLFEAAMAEVSVERAPGLRVQMAHGLLDLLYREERWSRAVEIAQDIDAALTLAEADPRLSAGVRLQGARLRAAVTSKHVSSLWALGRVLEAAIVLERARGRRIAIAMSGTSGAADMVSEDAGLAIAAAGSALREALTGNDDTACRLAWEHLAQVRRTAGLDLGSRDDALAALRHAAPSGGAFVQLHFSDRASCAFVWHQGAETPSLVELPQRAFADIGALFWGTSGWIATYDRAVGATVRVGSRRDGIAAWARKIEQCQRLLGDLIFNTLAESLDSAGIERGGRLLICPPGDLALLPIATACLRDGEHAAERWPISIVPNAAILMGETRPVDNSLCVGGWTDGTDGHPALPMAVMETNTLAGRVPGMTMLPAAMATPARLVAAMASASVVHIACHAVYDANLPGASGIELPGARLSLSRLASSMFAQVSTRLVYLSCCEAGMTGRTRDFDEFVGLPGGFLQIGVQGVVASLWAVDDVAAMVFAQAFYDRWQLSNSEVSPAEALGLAQRWMRTATWEALDAAGYLPKEVIERFRLGRFRSALRRVEKGSPADGQVNGSTACHPFQHPMHWAGWTLFGR